MSEKRNRDLVYQVVAILLVVAGFLIYGFYKNIKTEQQYYQNVENKCIESCYQEGKEFDYCKWHCK